MQMRRLVRLSAIYALVYVFLLFQFNCDLDVLINFMTLDFSSFGLQTITIQIEFFGLQILKFYLINSYIDFFIQLKNMIEIRKRYYYLVLIENILIGVFIMMLPDIIIIKDPFDILKLTLKIFCFASLYMLQLLFKNKINIALLPLIYCGLLLFISWI